MSSGNVTRSTNAQGRQLHPFNSGVAALLKLALSERSESWETSLYISEIVRRFLHFGRNDRKLERREWREDSRVKFA